jgi:hypothetical protein
MPKGAIMRPEEYKISHLKKIFSIEKVLTLESVRGLLANPSKRTAIRKLNITGCRASYSHAGKYYTIDEYASYNKYGLWSFENIHFSRHGTLIETIPYLINHSKEGYFARELNELLHVRVHNPLAKLFTHKRVVREQIGGEYLYLSPISPAKQLENRHQSIQLRIDQSCYAAEDIPETIQEGIRFLISHLNEKQRRLYLGLESMKLGHGGDLRISRISDVNVKTIARGRRELVSKKVTLERIRRIGAGRPPLKKNRSDQDIK